MVLDGIFRRERSYTGESKIFSKNNIQVHVDLNPIGGFVGKEGTLKLDHKDKKVFTDWSESDLKDAAHACEQIYAGLERDGIKNVLFIGKQQGSDFVFSIVTYKNCGIFRKLKCLWQAISWDQIRKGTPLTQSQGKAVIEYHTKKYEITKSIIGDKDDCKVSAPSKQKDILCDEKKLNHQHIKSATFAGTRRYNIYHDNCPKGPTKDCPHIMLVPKEESGHATSFHQRANIRFDHFTLAQKISKNFLKDGFKTIYFVEREGDKLPSIKHKSFHIQGTKATLVTFFSRLFSFLRLLCPSKLPLKVLASKVTYYKEEFKTL